MVQQPSLDPADASPAVRGVELPEVPSPGRRPGAEPEVPRTAGTEAGRGLSPHPPVRLLRMPRDQRLGWSRQAAWPRHAGAAGLPRGGRGSRLRSGAGRPRRDRGGLGRGGAIEPRRSSGPREASRCDRAGCRRRRRGQALEAVARTGLDAQGSRDPRHVPQGGAVAAARRQQAELRLDLLLAAEPAGVPAEHEDAAVLRPLDAPRGQGARRVGEV